MKKPAAPKTPVRRISNDRVTNEQLALFESLVDVRFSNTIEVYDLMPKYLQERVTTFAESDLPPDQHVIQRRFQTHVVDHDGRRLPREGYVKLKPAVIIRKKGEETKRLFAYPGYFEQLVEDAIRKLAVDQGAVLNDEGKVGCRFSISQIRKLLAETGHQCRHADVVEAITILNGAQLEYGLIDTDGKGRVSGRSPYFPTIYLRTRDDMDDGEYDSVVQFHDLVNQSIRERTFRNYDFITCMKYRMPLANYMHKRISMRFRQATVASPYTFHLKKMLADGGFNTELPLAKQGELMRKAMQELIEAGVISRYEYSLITDPGDRRRSVDATFDVFVTPEFERQVITINRHSKSLVSEAHDEDE